MGNGQSLAEGLIFILKSLIMVIIKMVKKLANGIFTLIGMEIRKCKVVL